MGKRIHLFLKGYETMTIAIVLHSWYLLTCSVQIHKLMPQILLATLAW